MIHPLVRKELREHRWVLVAMWVFCTLGLLGLLVAARSEASPLVAWRQLTMVFGVLLSLALANRFVVREYGGRTQLFLETLPIGRGRVIAAKWLISAACLLVPIWLCFGVILLVASHKVALTLPFVLLLAVRGTTFLLFFHALAMLIGLTGRYRYVLWVAIVLLAFIADSLGQFPIQQWPPLQLVSPSMPFERAGIPVTALWITGTVTVALIGAAFALALGFQGSWVVALSRRMSLREKVVVAASFLSVLFVVVQVEGRKPKPRFKLQDAVVSNAGLAAVSVARGGSVGDGEAAGLAQRLAADLQGTSAYLGLLELPSVAVLPDDSLDSDLFMLAKLPKSDGVVVRAAFGAAQFDEPAFRAFTISRVLDWHSRGRAARETRRWLLDGFSAWQIARQDPARRELLGLRAAVAVDAIEAGNASLEQALHHWFTTRENLGDCLGDALAWRAVQWLSDSLGEARFRSLARALLGTRSQPDLRAWLEEQPVDQLLRGAGAPAIAALAAELRAAMRGERVRFAARIAGVPRWPVRFTAVPMRGAAFELRYEVAVPPDETPPAFAVRYASLDPWQGELPRAQLARVDTVGPGVLPTSFPRGTRVLTAVEMPSPQLACTVRQGTRRWEVR